MLSNAAVSVMLPSSNIEETKKFYTDKLGLKVLKDEEWVVVFEAGNKSQIALFMSDPPKSEDTAASFEVMDLDEEMKELRDKDVVFEEYDNEYVKTIDGVATMDGERAAWIKDPEGNILCLHQGRKDNNPSQ